jgi:alkyl hydroperoxide reductase subunit AhpC
MLDALDATNVDAKGIPFTVRTVFVIDPKKIIRLMLSYPASTGRNFDEILRVVDCTFIFSCKRSPFDRTSSSPAR